MLKPYLHIRVTTKHGSQFDNHLKTTEVHLINKLVKDNAMVLVKHRGATKEEYKSIFG